MLENLLLGAVSLLGNTPTFFEHPLEIPATTFEITADAPWNSITVFTTDGTPLPSLEYLDTNQNWRTWETEDDRLDLSELIFFDEVRTKLQVRSQTEAHIIAHFFNTHIPGEDLRAQFSESTSDFLETSAESKKLLKKIPKYHLRADWGADESMRLAENFWSRTRHWFPIENRMVEAKYRPINIIKQNEDGKDLYWPISENREIAKFVIHHTAENVSKERNRTPAELMRAVYSYHTKTKGWGDIGYNFVIDRTGNIYEGREGYERNNRIPVGAHVAYRNIGTIGIALMGNFQQEEPTEAQLEVLALLISDLSRQIKADPLGNTKFWNKTTPNIIGHGAIASIGNGTACPGKNMISKLPELRTRVKEVIDILNEYEEFSIPKGRDFLTKSVESTKNLAKKDLTVERKESPIKRSISNQIDQIRRNEKKVFSIKIKNNSTMDWPSGSAFNITNTPDGTTFAPFRSKEKIRKGQTGTFYSTVETKTTPNGTYHISLTPRFLKGRYFPEQIQRATTEYTFKVSGDTRLLRAQATREIFSNKLQANTVITERPAPKVKENTAPQTQTPEIKVKIAGFTASYAQVTSTKPITITYQGNNVAVIPIGTNVKVHYDKSNNIFNVKAGQKKWDFPEAKFKKLSLQSEHPLTVTNYNNPRFGQGKIAYNSFRDTLNFQVENNKLIMVNQLPIEEYLWGLGEEPSTEHVTKRHVIHILARSYALVYSGSKRKFRTSLYDLEDDPRTSQLYLGSDWERYHTEQQALIKETEGQVVTKDGNPVIAPYFTQSSGQSVNPWASQYPWCRVRELPHDAGLVQRGHGVGLSGNTTRVLAEAGKTQQEIIDYFFDGLSIKKVF